MKTYPFEPVTRAMAARILNISLGTLDKHVRDGDLPPPRPLGNGRQLYWLPEEFFPCVRRGLQRPDVEVEQTGTHSVYDAPGRPNTATASPTDRKRSTVESQRSTQRPSSRVRKLNA
jgi:hypothetical protein